MILKLQRYLTLVQSKMTSLFFIFLLFFPSFVFSQQNSVEMDVSETIQSAIKASLEIQQSQSEIAATQAHKKAQLTEFFPTFNEKYNYIHRDEPTVQSLEFKRTTEPTDAIINPQDEFQFITSFSQPIFTGFELINKYKISKLKVNIAEFSKAIICRDTSLDAVNAYFLVLKYQKLVKVALDTVTQLQAQKEVANNMYQAGMTSITDLLQSEVELANAKQDLIKSKNNLKNAQAGFNILLRRSIYTPVHIVDISDYFPFDYDLEYCLAHAKANRIELKMAGENIEIAQKEYELSKNEYYPDVALIGSWTRRGTDMLADGGEGIGDKSFWDIHVSASWDFWSWGRTKWQADEKFHGVSQAISQKNQLDDSISIEVHHAYLTMTENREGIATAEIAIKQARENFRITEEKYKTQVLTMTDYLIAQTLLTKTLTAYYNALYDFIIAKAVLYRAIGQKIPVVQK